MIQRLTRQQAIDALRAKLRELTDDEHCVCRVAREKHVYCGGFSQWTYEELRERYAFIVKTRPHASRPELEDLANRWQLAQQFVKGTELSCDTQTEVHHTCEGFDGFSNERLEGFHRDLLGAPVEIVDPEPAADAKSAPARARE